MICKKACCTIVLASNLASVEAYEFGRLAFDDCLFLCFIKSLLSVWGWTTVDLTCMLVCAPLFAFACCMAECG